MDWIDDVVPHLTGLAHLATVGPDGRPAVAVVSCLADTDGVWAQTRRDSSKARNIAVHPPVALMWEGSAEVYVWGNAVLVDDVSTKQRRWSEWSYDASAFFGRADDSGVVLIHVRPERATLLAAGEAGPERRTWRAG
ncbi:MAG: pyridoxamine 5'-phosphate oxidase family protein [Microthrixaceae bacterium]|nr:pyridoxamine 5'-phosphate oxidase family protein [Microthrixaceae bacterium]